MYEDTCVTDFFFMGHFKSITHPVIYVGLLGLDMDGCIEGQ